MVAASRLKHAGRARRARRGEGRGRHRRSDGADRPAAGTVGHRTARGGPLVASAKAALSKDDRADNARAEQRAFEAAGHEPRERAEARLSKQRADLIEAKTRIGEGAREQVEAPR